MKTESLYADPVQIIDKQRTAEKLSQIFPEYGAADILRKLKSSRRFVWIKRGVTPAEQEAILQIGEPALSYVQEDYRFYPQGRLMSHVVGMINRDGQGTYGVERGLDETLANFDAESVANGEAKLKTALDVRIQHILHRELGNAVKRFDAKAGAGIVMDVETGEILAAVSLPDFDP
ncbi:MAG: penicillin-binding protein 2, partial [Pseudomonadota bacterium]|nr:penicillin-binding protein 2 [Pseudomonadota bacterium]